MDINVTGTFTIAQAAANEMKKADISGSMVLVASMSGYGANKVRWTKLIAAERVADRNAGRGHGRL